MALKKHSLNLSGHASSVTMEPAFWAAFKALAKQRGLTLNALASEIDSNRDADTNLASAIRLTILKDLQSRAGSK